MRFGACFGGVLVTMLHASLQLWQSLSCAKIVIVGQRSKRKVRDRQKQGKKAKTSPQTQATDASLTNRVSGETR